MLFRVTMPADNRFDKIEVPKDVEIDKDEYGNNEMMLTPTQFAMFVKRNSLSVIDEPAHGIFPDRHVINRFNTMMGQVWYTEGEYETEREMLKDAY